MSVLNSQSFSNTYIKMRWKEQYVTQGLNQKTFGVTRSGIYAGFVITPVGVSDPMKVEIGGGTVSGGIATGYNTSYASGAYDPTYGYSIAVEETNNGYNNTIQWPVGFKATIDCSSAAGTRAYVVLRMSYGISTDTTGSVDLVTASEIDTYPNLVVIGAIDVPSSGAITLSDIVYDDASYPRLTPLATSLKAGLMPPYAFTMLNSVNAYNGLLDIGISNNSNFVVTITPSQNKISGKRIYSYVQASTASKFPRDSAGKYNGGANNDALTNLDILNGTIGGAHEVATNLSFDVPSVIGTPDSFQVGLIAIDETDSISVTYSSILSSYDECIDEDNIPVLSSSLLQVGAFIVSTDSNGDMNPLSASTDLLKRNPLLNVGGGSGGSGSGVGDDLNSLNFQASFGDTFQENPTSSLTSLDFSTGKTKATDYQPLKKMYELSYDATVAATSGCTATDVTVDGTPSFTVTEGCVIIVGGVVRPITTVVSQTHYLVDSLGFAPTQGTQVVISEAVHTLDINNLDLDGSSANQAFDGAAFSEVMVRYKDNDESGSNVFFMASSPVVAWSGSTDGVSWSTKNTRPDSQSDAMSSVVLPTSDTSLYLRFFANATSGSGIVNLIDYKVYFQKLPTQGNSTIINQASVFTDGSGTPLNATVGLMGGKTTITLTTFSIPMGVNSGLPFGVADIYLNGQFVEQYVSATATPDAWYNLVSPNVIQLDSDYSSRQLKVVIILRTLVVDNSSRNSTDISALKSSAAAGFQSFVDTSNQMVAVTSTGTPAVGTFYSSITNRANIVDLNQDLKARIGSERFPAQIITQIANEVGPNNELVFGLVNDDRGVVRFAGSGWSNQNDANGQRIQTTTQNDFVEFTFFGTGLNVLLYPEAVTPPNIGISIDGGTESTSVLATGVSSVISARATNPNTLFNVATGLSQGVHTVRLKKNASAAGVFAVYGYEVLNDTSTIKVNSGVSYVAGTRLLNSTQQSIPYGSSFESGTLGTTGGRVVVYQKSDGTFGKSVTVPAGAQTLTNANHSTEDVSRVFHWREFGAGRATAADDFSTAIVAGSPRAFTLDDGVTSLVASSANSQFSETIGHNTNSTFISFTFVGTGLDIVQQDSNNGGADNYTVQIDNGASISLPTSGNTAKRVTKIVSGLPYGTHVVRINRITAATWVLGIHQFIVYQPKKPTLPAGAIEICDYNLLANFTANATAGADTIAAGVIRKHNTREFIYSGTWSYALAVTDMGGYQIASSTTGDFVQYTFWGTGFDMRFTNSATSATWAITVDGVSNLSTLTTSSYGAGVTSFTNTTGVLVTSTTTTSGNGVRVSGLTLGWHTFKITKTAGAGAFAISSLEIITPIHSYRNVSAFDLQNTMLIGNVALSDNRKTTAIKESFLQKKNISFALGSNSGPTTTSTAGVPLPDMSVTHSNTSGKIKIFYSVAVANTTVGQNIQVYAVVDGVIVGFLRLFTTSTANFGIPLTDSIPVNVTPGVHKIDLYWLVSGGTGTSTGQSRTLIVEEV